MTIYVVVHNYYFENDYLGSTPGMDIEAIFTTKSEAEKFIKMYEKDGEGPDGSWGQLDIEEREVYTAIEEVPKYEWYDAMYIEELLPVEES